MTGLRRPDCLRQLDCITYYIIVRNTSIVNTTSTFSSLFSEIYLWATAGGGDGLELQIYSRCTRWWFLGCREMTCILPLRSLQDLVPVKKVFQYINICMKVIGVFFGWLSNILLSHRFSLLTLWLVFLTECFLQLWMFKYVIGVTSLRLVPKIRLGSNTSTSWLYNTIKSIKEKTINNII